METSVEAIARELAQARAARARGNEGMARVCARRAAGAAAGEYLRHNGLPDPGPSALDRLNTLLALPHLPAACQQPIRRLLQRVDEDYQLPPGVDLIAEAETLVQTLLPPEA